MTPADRAYWARRLCQELQQAERATAPEVARPHLEMARRYAALIDAGDLGLDQPAEPASPAAQTRIGIST